MKFGRHGTRRAKLYKVSIEDVEAALPGEPDGFDTDGNPRFRISVRGAIIRVIIASDDPNRVITLYRRKK